MLTTSLAGAPPQQALWGLVRLDRVWIETLARCSAIKAQCLATTEGAVLTASSTNNNAENISNKLTHDSERAFRSKRRVGVAGAMFGVHIRRSPLIVTQIAVRNTNKTTAMPT